MLCFLQVGRPKTTHCKRGHERVPGEKSCIKCRRLREQWRYHSNPELRQRKCEYQRQWRRDFVKAHGFWPSMLDGTRREA